jgi:tetratricopeptide (TPR) repeat protein
MLDRYYEWVETEAVLLPGERQSRVADALAQQLYLEAYLWATVDEGRGRLVPGLAQEVLDAAAKPLDRWALRMGITHSDSEWRDLARRIATRARIDFAKPRDVFSTMTLTRGEALRLSEVLLLDAVDRIQETRAEEILRYEHALDRSASRFCRWRAFAHNTGKDSLLVDYEQAIAEDPPYPEVLEDLMVNRFRRRRFDEAFDPLLLLWERFPERAERHVGAYRRAFKARLTRLIETEQLGEALDFLRLGDSLPFEVLDPDMATYAIYYRLLQDQEENPEGVRGDLIKFLLNHSAFAEASYVSQALRAEGFSATLPDSYHAIMEAQLGNAGMAYQHLQLAIQREPPSAAFFFALGLVNERFKNLWNLAARCYEQALDLDPGYEPALLALARHALVQGRIQEASDRAHRVLEQHPENDLAQYEAARIALAQGELDRARDLFTDLARGVRAEPEYFLFLAQILLKQGHPGEARRWITDLVRWSPQNATAYFLLADAARAEKNGREEVDALETAYEITRPWRFERLQAARQFQVAAERLARLGIRHPCSPTFRVSSVKQRHPYPIAPSAGQSPGPWTIPPMTEGMRIEASPPPRWMTLEQEWVDASGPVLWRTLSAGETPETRCHNELEIHNPSPFEMLGVRIFVDGREFAFQYRLLPDARMFLTFNTEDFPRQIGLVYTTDTGFQEALLPRGLFSRRVDPAFRF